MSGRIYFGSLEGQVTLNPEKPTNNTQQVNLIDLKNLPTFSGEEVPTSSSGMTGEQSFEFERRKVAKDLRIPTNDGQVKQSLRSLGLPIILFGEGPVERRARLTKIASLLVLKGRGDERILSLYPILKTFLGTSDESSLLSSSTDENEEFYVAGSIELVQLRRGILEDSLRRSQQRLQRERQEFVKSNLEGLQVKRVAFYEKCKEKLELKASYVGDERPLSCISVGTRDGFVLGSGGWNGRGRLWSLDAKEGRCEVIGEFEHGTDRITCMAFNPIESNGQLASSGVDGCINLWRQNDSLVSKQGSLIGHTARVNRISYHPTGSLLASTSHDYSWRLWNIERSVELQLQEGHSEAVYGLDFHPDGGLLATSGMDSVTRIWDLRNGRAIWTIIPGGRYGHCKSILSVTFNPMVPNSIMSSGEDGTIRLWDLRSLKQESLIIPAHNSLVSQSIFTPCGQAIISAGYDNTVKVWSARGQPGKLLKDLRGHDNKVMGVGCIAVGKDEKEEEVADPIVLSVSYDRTLKLWSPC